MALTAADNRKMATAKPLSWSAILTVFHKLCALSTTLIYTHDTHRDIPEDIPVVASLLSSKNCDFPASLSTTQQQPAAPVRPPPRSPAVRFKIPSFSNLLDFLCQVLTNLSELGGTCRKNLPANSEYQTFITT